MCRGIDAAAAGPGVSQHDVLPTNVKPIHYDLTLEPNLTTFDYEGTVTIDLEVVEDTKSISLNTIDLKISETKVVVNGKEIALAKELEVNKESEVTTTHLSETISKGSKIQLTHVFSSVLNDTLAGFYRSKYKTAAGEEKYMATTQMEATDARRAFPCFDEPALKAEFTVTLVADKHLVCLSNMDVKSEKEVQSKMSGGPKKAVTFNKSPLMSTYLLAFIVGELNVLETDAFRIPVRVFAPPDQDIEHGRFALELAAKTLEFYEKTFDSPFPLPKMDMVAIPDFSAGAMENWGLVTYRDVDMLLDEKKVSAASKQRVAETVQHELAHQWFGNLVTMDFWEGLWLNEGFATWMSWYSCNIFFPEWKVWQSYVANELQAAFSLDSLRSSHPIEVPIKRADEINQIFDAISYQKGSCVIRMVSKWLGEETFMEGIRRYLRKHAYGNTQTGDLWAALADASGKNVDKVMTVWTKKIGYPVVKVTEDGKGNIHLKQNRFLRTADVKPDEDETIYPAFLGLRTKDGVDESHVLDSREKTIQVKDTSFFKLNADHSGFYRTLYSSERLSSLGEAAKQGLLSTEDRAGMIADAGALAASGYQKTSGVFSLLKEFGGEKEFVVWDEITARIAAVRAAWIFEDQKTQDALKAFQRDLVSKKAHEVGWEWNENDSHILQQFKALLFSSAALAGDEKAVNASKEMFEKFRNGDEAALHPNFRAGVFACVLQNGGEAEYDAILDIYRKATKGTDRMTALRSLGRASKPELVQRSLALSISKEVKTSDIYVILASLRTSRNGIEAMWAWVKKNWAELERLLPPALTMMSSVIAISTASFTHQSQLDDINNFFKDKSTKGFDQSLAQTGDAVRAKEGWIKRDSGDIEAWLKENKYL